MGYGAGIQPGYGAGRGVGFGAGAQGRFGAGPASGFGAGYEASSWSPLSLGSSLAAWGDTSDAATVFQDAGKTTLASADTDRVRVIADKSGHGADFVFPSDGTRGTLKTGIFGSRRGVRLNGVDQYAEAAISTYSGTQVTVCCSIIQRAASTTGGIVAFRASAGGDSNDSAARAIPLIEATNGVELPGSYRNNAETGNAAAGATFVTGDAVVLTSTYDGSNSTVYVNREPGAAVASTGSFSFDRVLVGAWWSGAAAFFRQDDIGEIVVVAGALSASDRSLLHQYMVNKWLVGAPKMAVADGDSITYGYGLGAGEPYPDQLLASLGASWRMRNLGVNSQTIVDMASDAVASVDVLYVAPRSRNVLLCFGGTNDITSGASAATVYANIAAYCAGRRAAGFKVLVFTMLPRATGWETARATLNALIVAGWSSFADGLVDVGADATIGVEGAQNNATYYQVDTIHPTAAGSAVIAALAKAAIDALP